MCEPGKHRWPRHEGSILSGAVCRRQIWTCNQCFATKVKLTVYGVSEGADISRTVVVELPTTEQAVEVGEVITGEPR